MKNAYVNLAENNYNEQVLAEDVVEEMIALYGIDARYLPRNINRYDQILGEDAESRFEVSLPIACYLISNDNYQGNGTLFTKFNIEVRDTIFVAISIRGFERVATSRVPDTLTRPREGDLIYIPMMERFFQVRYVRRGGDSGWFQFGAQQYYTLTLDMYEYSNEIFDTGDELIDALGQTINSNVPAHFEAPTDTRPDRKGSPDPAPAPATSTAPILRDNESLDEELSNIIDSAAPINPFYRRHHVQLPD